MTGWLTDAFVAFLKSLTPFVAPPGELSPDGGWGHALLGVWIPDLSALTGAGFGWIMGFTIALGTVVALWYATPALVSAIATSDARAIGQVLIGLMAVTAAGPLTLWVAATLRLPVLDTATTMAGDLVSIVVDQTLEEASVLGVLALVLASITYMVAGLIGSYAFVLIVILAPIAASSLVFKSGTQSFFKWLAWFLTMLLAPIWAAIGFGVAAYLSAANDAIIISQLATAVGVILAAAVPFTMLAVIGKVIPHGGGADNATRIGSGQTVGSAVAYATPRAIK